ncbi:MAG: GNAT family N-acetyltransferase [Bacteroidales bacterium]|nr:GNAT family N-acetyltransferase [Bacteroidales bacterium]MDD4684018.1 GNAT family N-acetyltransferase [Bacteroidales bacterium]
MENVRIRKANKRDTPLILNFIKDLSVYEKLPHEVSATVEILHKSLFVEKNAKVVFILEGEKEVGFALYFYNFSTFTGKKGLYLEDLFVLEEYRGKGYGKKLLAYLADIAIKEDCSRFEWIVLDWNTPSIEFYKSLKAFPLSDWTVFRLQKEDLTNLAKQNKL